MFGPDVQIVSGFVRHRLLERSKLFIFIFFRLIFIRSGPNSIVMSNFLDIPEISKSKKF